MRALVAVILLSLPLSACFVQSRCQSDHDCIAPAGCSLQTGRCEVECYEDADCFSNGQDVGKVCLNNRCEFLLAERTNAPGFCLEDVNPQSTYHPGPLCMADLEGKVVMIYFALLG